MIHTDGRPTIANAPRRAPQEDSPLSDPVSDAIKRNDGQLVPAFFEVVAGLVRDNPATFKIGYSPAAALSTALRVVPLTDDDKRALHEGFQFIVEKDRPKEPLSCTCGKSLDANGEHDGGYGSFCG